MSRRHRRNARSRRGQHYVMTRSPDGFDVPLLVERREYERVQSANGLSYEEANWAKLSPRFRDAHNRLLQARGMPTIPPPRIDLYVPPAPTKVVSSYLPNSPEVKALAREFEGGMMLPGDEGGERRDHPATWINPEKID